MCTSMWLRVLRMNTSHCLYPAHVGGSTPSSMPNVRRRLSDSVGPQYIVYVPSYIQISRRLHFGCHRLATSPVGAKRLFLTCPIPSTLLGLAPPFTVDFSVVALVGTTHYHLCFGTRNFEVEPVSGFNRHLHMALCRVIFAGSHLGR